MPLRVSVCDLVFSTHSSTLLCLTKTSTLGMSLKSPVFMYVHCCCWRVWVARVGVCFEQTHRCDELCVLVFECLQGLMRFPFGVGCFLI